MSEELISLIFPKLETNLQNFNYFYEFSCALLLLQKCHWHKPDNVVQLPWADDLQLDKKRSWWMQSKQFPQWYLWPVLNFSYNFVCLLVDISICSSGMHKRIFYNIVSCIKINQAQTIMKISFIKILLCTWMKQMQKRLQKNFFNSIFPL